jgi:acyl carrier protein
MAKKININTKVRDDLIKFLKIGNPLISELKKIPLDKSLLELGYIDSFGVIEIVIYLEKKYRIKINNDELTKSKFGSLNKMSKLVSDKLK